jgi:DNA-binding PadR family transcriptional regulator
MAEEHVRMLLDGIGVVMSKSEEDVLAAILETCKNQNSATFDDIQTLLAENGSKKMSKQWIYQCLSNLDEAGFIQAVRGFPQDPTKYVASILTLRAGLKKAQTEKSQRLDQEERKLSEDIKKLESLEPSRLAHRLIESFTEESQGSSPIVVQGITSVRNIFQTEILENSNRGDIVRLGGRFSFIDLQHPGESSVELKIIEKSIEGVVIRALIQIGKDQIDDALEENIDFFLSMREVIIESIKSGYLELRVIPMENSTYQFVSLNSEKMLLFLTGTKQPDTVALFTRHNRSVLLDDAIGSFDQLWAKAMDLNGILYDFLKNI